MACPRPWCLTGGLTDIAFGTVKRQTLLFMYMGEEVEHQPGDDEQPTLEPIETCYIVARDVPVTVKAQLMIINPLSLQETPLYQQTLLTNQ